MAKRKKKPLPYSHPENPLRRYNQVRSALSEYLRETVPPIPVLRGGYKVILKGVWEQYKDLDINEIADRIPEAIERYLGTSFPIIFGDPKPYYEIKWAVKDTLQFQKEVRRDVYENTFIHSHLFFDEKKKLHPAIMWEDSFTRTFFAWIDENRDRGLNLFEGSIEIPHLIFTKPQQSKDRLTFITEVVIDEDTYRWSDEAKEAFLQEFGGKWEDYTSKTKGIADDEDLLKDKDIREKPKVKEEPTDEEVTESEAVARINAGKEIKLKEIESQERIQIKTKKLDDLKELLKDGIIDFATYKKERDEIN